MSEPIPYISAADFFAVDCSKGIFANYFIVSCSCTHIEHVYILYTYRETERWRTQRETHSANKYDVANDDFPRSLLVDSISCSISHGHGEMGG